MINDDDIQNYLTKIKNLREEPQIGTTDPQKTFTTKTDSPMNFTIDSSCDIRGIQRMQFGNNVVVQKDCWLNIAHNNPNSLYMIKIGEGTNIGRRSTISAANIITIGKNVLFGPNVLISDHNHEYQVPGLPILRQGITAYNDQVVIGDDTWVGTNTVIVGNVRIGKHCVIGANSLVNKDIPDYCVAVGNPCRIVKLFDISQGKWVNVTPDKGIDTLLASRKGDLLEYLVPLSNLRSLQVEVSSACNLKCPQCFQFIDGHKKGLFDRKLWDTKIHPIMKQLRDIHLVGIGEPFLCKDFFYFVEDSRKHNVRVHTTSNLQLVTDEMAKEIVESGIEMLSFSCDGISKETYDKIRVNGSIETLKKSLEMINRYKKLINSPFPKLILNFGGMKTNIHELPQVVELAKSNRIDHIIAYHNVIYVEDLKNESLFHYQEISDKKFIEAKQLADKFGIKMFLPGLFSCPALCKNNNLYCSYPYNHLYIYSDGRVGPCCMDFPDRYTLGDLYESSIEEVWNSIPILQLRKELSVNPSETCRYCVAHGKMDISDPRYLFRFKGSEAYIKKLI